MKLTKDATGTTNGTTAATGAGASVTTATMSTTPAAMGSGTAATPVSMTGRASAPVPTTSLRSATGRTNGTDLESGHHAPLATASTTTACAAMANGATADTRSTGRSSAQCTTGAAERLHPVINTILYK